MQPYLLAFCERKEYGLTRSVLTAVARVGPNKTLFATCKHVITQTERLFVVDENGKVMQSKWAVIPVPNPVLDLMFLFIRQDVPANRIRMNTDFISRGTELTHARNQFSETETPSPFVNHSATASRSRFYAELGQPDDGGDLCFRFLKSEGEFDEAKREGVKTFYPVLEMESWKGVSGSALWDKYGSIRGIVCGGDRPETRQADGLPRLVYIPAKAIAKQVKLILKHPGLRARMMSE